MAAQSHVAVSFEEPEYTANSDALGTLRLLEIIRNSKFKKIKFYQAGTSELYGKIIKSPQDEKTPFYPRSPYALQNYMHTGLQLIIEKHLIFLLVTGFLIMKVQEEERRLLQKNSKRSL